MRTIVLTLSKEEVLNIIDEISKTMNLVQRKKDNNSFYFKKTGSLISFGNTVSVKLSRINNRNIELFVDSSSSNKLQVIDWGLNENIEEEFIKLVNEYTVK